MLSLRADALLTVREQGGEGAAWLDELDRVLRSRLFRSNDKMAKALRALVEDEVLGIPLKLPAFETLKDVQHMLELYTRGEGQADPIHIALSIGICGLTFERTTPRIFISHRHVDENLAAALVSVLHAAFEVSRNDIRCTSVWPHRLSVGVATFERIRDEIRLAEAVLGLISPELPESKLVPVELIAAWAHGRMTCPLLVRGAQSLDVPEPIRGTHALFLANPSDCHQLIDEITRSTTLRRKSGAGGDISDKVQKLAFLAAA